MKRGLYIGLLTGLVVISCTRVGNKNSLTLSGTLEFTEYAVGAHVAGRIDQLNVEEGALVKKGDMLATLQHYEQAKREYERNEQLFRQGGGVSKQEEERSLVALQDQQVVSPVDGIVLLKTHEPGEVVPANAPIAVIGDKSSPWVRVFVPEGWINRIALNQPASIRFDGLDKTFQGHVIFISPRVEFTPRNVQTPEERVTQTFAIKVALDVPNENLRPGIPADVAFEFPARATQ